MPGNIAPPPDADKSAVTGNLVALCVEAAEGQVNAALLLMRILFWTPKARIERAGHKWIAKSGADWAAEMHRSLDQYKRAIAWLRQHDLIVTEQHLFGGKNVTFTRLTERGMTLLPKGGQAAAPGRGTTAPPKKRNAAPLHEQGETHKEEHQGEDCVPTHATAVGNPPQDSGVEEMSASNAEPDSLPALEELWRSRVAETYGGFVPNWTAKERGQMTNFRKLCPPGAAPAVLEASLNDWALFATLAKANAGAWDLPARPTVSFLLKFVGVAVNLWLSKAKPKASPEPKAPAPPSPQPAPAAPILKPAPGEEKASLETVMAAAFGLS